MIQQYSIKEGVAKKTFGQAQFIIVKDASNRDEKEFIKKYKLPEDVFLLDDLTPVAPRIERLYDTDLGDILILVIANVALLPKNEGVESRLESHTFILSAEKLYWFTVVNDTNLDHDLMEKYNSKFDSLESILIYTGLTAYSHLEHELQNQKEMIDELHESAKTSTKNSVLVQASETEKDLVLLGHTIDAMSATYGRLIADDEFRERLSDSRLVYDIKWYSQQVQRLSAVYKDLLMTVSGLFSDIMTNNLNKIMKFLSSFALVLSGASLVGELWGINAGGLFFEHHKYGSMIVFAIAFLAAFLVYLYIRNKDFFDD